MPSQSAKPLAQVNPHVPLVHVGIAFGTAGHVLPHAPQFVTVSSVASQPSAGMPLQLSKPASHVPSSHFAFVHVALPFAKEQALLQNAQFSAVPSVVSQPSTLLELQSAVPGVQGLGWHLPCLHVSKAVHCVPQVPQFAGSFAICASQPLTGSLSQFSNPALHAPSAQLPETHAPAAFCAVHRVPQVPQFAGSVPVAASQPLLGSESQSANPALHEPTVQEPPAVQAGVAFGGLQGVQELPQPYAASSAGTHVPLQLFSFAAHPAAPPPDPTGSN